MTSIHYRIAAARQQLVDSGLSPGDAALDADVLARHALGWDRGRLIADGRDPMPAASEAAFAESIARRAKREPVAMITGHREFWGLDFHVTPDVLIPRPETELIVEAAIERRPDRSRVRRIADVGTGTGCLAVSLATEFPEARVVAIDMSPAALAVARGNARAHRAERVAFLRADLLEALTGPFDLIVSNPPYVPAGVALAPEIRRFEPPIALYSGEDGLAAIRRLLPAARTRLAPDGLFIVEFGLGQDDAVADIAAQAGYGSVITRNDLQGIPRIAVMSA